MADQLESESAAALLSFKKGGFGIESIKQEPEEITMTMEVDVDEAPILGPAILGLQRVGEEMPPRPIPVQPGLVLNRRGMPARIRKKNRLFFDDDVVNILLPRTTKRGIRSPHKKGAFIPKPPMAQVKKEIMAIIASQSQEQTPPTVLEQHEGTGPVGASPDRRTGQRIGMRLRNLLKLPKAHKWVCYEWFYSNIDLPLFNGENDFMLCLREVFPHLKTRKMTRSEWAKIRHMMGKPRRCSQAFFEEERRELERKRAKMRLLQQRKTADVTNCKDLPEEIPLQLVIGTKVTARLRRPQDGLFTGSIDAVDTSNNTYRITFERQGLGTHSVPDYEVLSNDPPETITVSSFAQKFRPRNLSFMTPPRFCESLSPRSSDSPVGNNAGIKVKSIPTDGMLGGFPVKCLDMIVRLSKILNAKKNKVKLLRDMNAEAEKRKSFGGTIGKNFQHRYANIIVGLERLNGDLEGYLTSVQKYCQEIAPEPGQAAVLIPAHLQEKSHREAKDVFDVLMQTRTITKKRKMMTLMTHLGGLAIQVKSLGETDRSAYEVKVLQSSMEQIRALLEPQNRHLFQNAVEIHMQHIQTDLYHSGFFNQLVARV